MKRIGLLISHEYQSMYNWLQTYGEIRLFTGVENINWKELDIFIIPDNMYCFSPDDLNIPENEDHFKINTKHRTFFLNSLDGLIQSRIPILAVGNGADVLWNHSGNFFGERIQEDPTKFYKVEGWLEKSLNMEMRARSYDTWEYAPFVRTVKGLNGYELLPAEHNTPLSYRPFLWKTDYDEASLNKKAITGYTPSFYSSKNEIVGFVDALYRRWGIKFLPHKTKYKKDSATYKLTGNRQGELITNKILCRLLELA
jgi:hypothetical protein